ncbi:hypothetical protein N9R79_08060 [Vibrio sp.]|nr:hypothetical protein [Vibrio sp.]
MDKILTIMDKRERLSEVLFRFPIHNERNLFSAAQQGDTKAIESLKTQLLTLAEKILIAESDINAPYYLQLKHHLPQIIEYKLERYNPNRGVSLSTKLGYTLLKLTEYLGKSGCDSCKACTHSQDDFILCEELSTLIVKSEDYWVETEVQPKVSASLFSHQNNLNVMTI